MEEVLHFEHALGRVDVLVADDARHRGLVHADIDGHVAQHHRAQVLDAVVEKLLLLAHDAVRNLVDRLLALVDRLDEPQRASQLVFDVLAGRLVLVRLVLEHAPIDRADAQLRQTVLVEHDLVLAVDLHHVNVGSDVVAPLVDELRARLRVEVRRMISQCSMTSSSGSFIAFRDLVEPMVLQAGRGAPRPSSRAASRRGRADGAE